MFPKKMFEVYLEDFADKRLVPITLESQSVNFTECEKLANIICLKVDEKVYARHSDFW